MIAIVATAVPAATLCAQRPAASIQPGHSAHGAAFNEGPRQKAYLMGGTGRVRFPVTSKDPIVQNFIEQGVGQLYGFWYLEAERSFRQAAAIQPDCAMAYWGAAAANLIQPWFAGDEQRAKGFIAEAVKRKHLVSRREAMYVAALNEYLHNDKTNQLTRINTYSHALENIALEFPDDIEAKAFVALQIYKTVEIRIKQNDPLAGPTTGHLAAEALLQQIFAVEPLHPAHHFRIHLWDHRRPEQALDSAAVCGQAAPAIAHMWHMPGHIYSRLARYDDACWHQEASARVDHAHLMRDRLMPDEIHNFTHNNEWLVRNLINVGRVRDAIDLAKNMIQLPQHPRYNTYDTEGSARYGRAHLFRVLTQYELWDELISLCETAYLAPTHHRLARAQRLRYLATAYYRRGDPARGKRQLALLGQRYDHLRSAKSSILAAAVDRATADGLDKTQIAKARSNAAARLDNELHHLEGALDELKGYQALAEGDYEQALTLLELARVEPSYLARVYLLAGDAEAAEETIRIDVQSNPNEVQPLAVMVDLFWQLGKRQQAAEAMERLRQVSAAIDMQSPVFTRLAPIARELGLPVDWRVERPAAEDIGARPELDSLGPFRWRPSAAPQWTLSDAHGQQLSLRQYRGRPLIAIFYLGYQCLHCAEQLAAFAPAADEFARAGIELAAISTDDAAGLKKSIENYDGGEFPFPLLADGPLEVFKEYRCYDDFEKQPLHGTFLIDAEGLVRWQDISYQPFMDHRFLLREAKRLLAQ